MEKMKWFLSGFALGSLVAGIAALLLAPMSGAGLRTEIDTRFDRMRTEGKARIEDLRLSMPKRKIAMRKPG